MFVVNESSAGVFTCAILQMSSILFVCYFLQYLCNIISNTNSYLLSYQKYLQPLYSLMVYLSTLYRFILV